MTLKTLTLAVSLLTSGLVLAEPPPEKSEVSIAIAITRQPMADALTELGRQIGMQVVIDSTLARGKTAPAVSGKLTVEQAMRSLLKDTGLRYEFVDERTIAVVSTSGRAAAGASGSEEMRFARTDGGAMKKVERTSSEALTTADGLAEAQSANDTAEMLVQGVRDTGVVNQGVIPRTENGAVRYEVIDRAEIERSGAMTLSDLLTRNVPQSANYGTGTHQAFGRQSEDILGGGGMTTPQDQVNLRGLGSGDTLVLVNGRRLYGGDDSGPDISRIPLSMVERVEILPSSGSAIYGANAVGGVVNIILRKDYAGRDFSAYFGTAQGGAEHYRLSGFQGFNLNDGRTNVSANVEFNKVEPLLLGERDYHRRVLERITPTSVSERNYRLEIINQFFGPVGTIVGGQQTFNAGVDLNIPGDPTANFAAIPLGSTGTGLTPASFSATAGTASISTSRLDRAPLVGPNESAGLFTTIEHALSDRLSAFSELSFRWTDNSTGSFADSPKNIRMLADNPLNPFPIAIAVHFDPVDIPMANQTSVQRSYRAVAGLRGTMNLFAGREYHWSADLSWDRNETEAKTVSYTQFLRNMVNPLDPDAFPPVTLTPLYNPLRDLTNAPMLPDEELRKMRSAVNVQSRPEITATNWRANGDLFEAWGGTAGVSVGAEYRRQAQYSSVQYDYAADGYGPMLDPFIQFSFPDNPPNEDTRNTYAAYVEVTLPLVGARNRMPMVESLDLSAALRYEKYDDFDAAKPPMVALKWALVRDLALRAQFSEGFQPPTAGDLAAALLDVADYSFLFEDPLRQDRVPDDEIYADVQAYSFGGNPNLRPEVSDTWDAGVILTPRWIPGLTVNVAYFEYDKRDVITTLSTQDAVNAGFVTRGPDEPDGTPGPVTAIQNTAVNVAREFINGWDFKGSYAFETAGGDFTFSAQATHTKNFQRQILESDPRLNAVGFLDLIAGDVPVKWTGNAALEWQRGGWGASWTSRYTHSFTTRTTTAQPPINSIGSGLDGDSIPSRVEHDVQLRYRIAQAPGRWGEWLSGTDFILGANNVFDREPELISSAGSLYHSLFADPRQRFMYFQINKSF